MQLLFILSVFLLLLLSCPAIAAPAQHPEPPPGDTLTRTMCYCADSHEDPKDTGHYFIFSYHNSQLQQDYTVENVCSREDDRFCLKTGAERFCNTYDDPAAPGGKHTFCYKWRGKAPGRDVKDMLLTWDFFLRRDKYRFDGQKRKLPMYAIRKFHDEVEAICQPLCRNRVGFPVLMGERGHGDHIWSHAETFTKLRPILFKEED